MACLTVRRLLKVRSSDSADLVNVLTVSHTVDCHGLLIW